MVMFLNKSNLRKREFLCCENVYACLYVCGYNHVCDAILYTDHIENLH